MTKGKYAARAANTRAENAADKAQRLETTLTRERAAHATETTDLKNQIQQLAGRLTREVGNLADARIAQARSEARDRVAAERARQHAAALEAYELVLAAHPQLDPDVCFRLCELLGLEPGEASAHYGVPRVARRLTGKKLRHGLDRFEQGDYQGLTAPPQAR